MHIMYTHTPTNTDPPLWTRHKLLLLYDIKYIHLNMMSMSYTYTIHHIYPFARHMHTYVHTRTCKLYQYNTQHINNTYIHHIYPFARHMHTYVHTRTCKLYQYNTQHINNTYRIPREPSPRVYFWDIPPVFHLHPVCISPYRLVSCVSLCRPISSHFAADPLYPAVSHTVSSCMRTSYI